MKENLFHRTEEGGSIQLAAVASFILWWEQTNLSMSRFFYKA